MVWVEHYDFDWIYKCDDTDVDLARLAGLVNAQYGMIGDLLLGERLAPSGGAGICSLARWWKRLPRGRTCP